MHTSKVYTFINENVLYMIFNNNIIIYYFKKILMTHYNHYLYVASIIITINDINGIKPLFSFSMY